MADKQVDLNEEPNPDSIFATHCGKCEKCGSIMDHPGFQVPVSRAFFQKTNAALPPVLTVPTNTICRFCLIQAIAPIEEPVKEDPNAGWLWRLITKSMLEPTGTKASRKSRVGKEVSENQDNGPSNTEEDQE